jgi:hypothetical protein
MFPRLVTLVNNETLSDAGTRTVDIDVVDPITALYIDVSLTNGAALCPDIPPAGIVSRIELVDGGEVYYSMIGQATTAAGSYDVGLYPKRFLVELAFNPQYDCMPVYFGRYRYDPMFAFDPGRLKNPQLKVTWAKNALHATGSVHLNVWAEVMEGSPAPVGCLLWKEMDSWTTVGSGDRVTELPVDWPYQKVLLRSYALAVNPITSVANFELNCDVGKLIPLDASSGVWNSVMKNWFPGFHYESMVTRDDGANAQHWGGNGAFVALRQAGGTDIVGGIVSGNSWITLSLKGHAGGAATGSSVWLEVMAWMLESCFVYPFGRQDEPTDWFPAASFKGIKAKTTQGGAGAAALVAIRQARPW